jgi:hypothetical protein
MPIDVTCLPIELIIGDIRCGFTYSPALPRDPSLDYRIAFDPIEITIGVEGAMETLCPAITPLEITLEMVGEPLVNGLVISTSYIPLTLQFDSSYFTLQDIYSNLVKWSKVGDFDFTKDQSNVSGERYMEWKGDVHHIKRLGDHVVVYGQNGVSVMKPVGNNYSLQNVHKIGTAGRGAVAGDETVHFFVDKNGKLFKIADKLIELDYSEYLSRLTDPVLSYDKRNGLLYLCDGSLGYVYSDQSQSMGQGPPNITGMDSQDGTLYVVAPGEIEVPKFEICTDVYDFKTRKFKTIYSVEIGINSTEDLFASVDYRVNHKEEFKQIDWFLVNPDGKAFPKCYGVEFRFRFKSLIYEYLEPNYIKIRGIIHGFSPLDSSDDRSFDLGL